MRLSMSAYSQHDVVYRLSYWLHYRYGLEPIAEVKFFALAAHARAFCPSHQMRYLLQHCQQRSEDQREDTGDI